MHVWYAFDPRGVCPASSWLFCLKILSTIKIIYFWIYMVWTWDATKNFDLFFFSLQASFRASPFNCLVSHGVPLSTLANRAWHRPPGLTAIVGDSLIRKYHFGTSRTSTTHPFQFIIKFTVTNIAHYVWLITMDLAAVEAIGYLVIARELSQTQMNRLGAHNIFYWYEVMCHHRCVLNWEADSECTMERKLHGR